MVYLSDKKCVACEGDTPPLTKAEAEKYLTQVSDKWHLEDSPPHPTGDSKTTNGNKIPRSGVGVKSIWAEFKFKNLLQQTSDGSRCPRRKRLVRKRLYSRG